MGLNRLLLFLAGNIHCGRAVAYAYSHTNPNANAHSYTHSNPNTHAHSYTHSHANTDSYTHADTLRH